MSKAESLVEIWRGDIVESLHTGHAVICDDTGQITQAWGDPDAVIYPRSSAKMIQALPLIESGAAAAHGLTTRQLALSCASHNGAPIHVDGVRDWLSTLALGESDLRCGTHAPMGEEDHHALLRAGQSPCQLHNNCSGKHAGFLTLNKHLKGHADYIEADHPVQRACLEAFEAVTGAPSPGYGIDGCSAPNHLTTLQNMARAMAFFASAQDGADARQTAAAQLWQAMIAHPELVAGEGRACTELMRACSEPVALKTGAEGYYIAILPTRKLGVALKISDGATRASECAIAAILVRLGVLDANHPAAQLRMNKPLTSHRGFPAGTIRPAATLL